MKKTRWIALVGLLMSLSACSLNMGGGEAAKQLNAAVEIKVPEGQDDFLGEPEEGMTAFATELTAAYLQGKNGENALVSPVSARFAFATLSEGAKEETKTELLRFLQASDMDTFRKQNTFLKAYLNSVGTEQERVVVRDSIWLDKRFTAVSPDFLERATKDHFAEIYSGDMGLRQVADQMNGWVEKATGGLIKPQIEPDAARIMMIMNTLYLKGTWTQPFSEKLNKQEEFRTADKTVTATFMHQLIENAHYTQTADYRIARLSMKNGCRYRVLLPNEGISLDSLLEGEKGKETLRALMTAKLDRPAQINWSVPQYQSGAEINLKDLMTDMGYGSLYSKQANYLGLVKDEAGDSIRPYPETARQLTKLIVDNEGVEAAAYTEIVLKTESAKPEEVPEIDMKLDRPYLYMVELAGAPLLIGTVQNPTMK